MTNVQTRKPTQKISGRLCKFPVDFQEEKIIPVHFQECYTLHYLCQLKWRRFI